ncbi:MAG TPA: hypothetical protein VLM38_18470, partial [Blastocatellia bacterium]|nr:hypothetical protein [Blastocatellia bacterium]
MRALALLGVFIVAKLLILSGRPLEVSPWAPIAYFWQDVLVALVFALLDRFVRRPWFGWTVYVACVTYVTINVPIGRVLSSPLTWPMLDAAGSALSDSIKRHVTPANLLLMSLVIVSGIATPFLLRRFDAKGGIAALISALLLVAIGPMATSRVETVGLGRNAIMALATSALPRISARTEGDTGIDWRESPIETNTNAEDMSELSGAAAGRNVVLIVLESAGAHYLQPYGASRDPMPNLSDLA